MASWATDAYESKKLANSESIRSFARFLDGLARLEEIDSQSWFEGIRDQENTHVIDDAASMFEESRAKMGTALEHCLKYKEWFPEERKEELTPSVETFGRVTRLLDQIVATLKAGELPTLSLAHEIGALMREEMIVGERKALAYRGTPGHFPVGSS